MEFDCIYPRKRRFGRFLVDRIPKDSLPHGMEGRLFPVGLGRYLRSSRHAEAFRYRSGRQARSLVKLGSNNLRNGQSVPLLNENLF